MYPKTVLVSGAGIAGTTLAYWLIRHGFEPILIERAPAFRSGGYMIDFWGVGYEVADRMGLLPRLRAAGYFIREFRLVDREGRWIGGFAQDSIRSLVGDRFLSILRGDLAREIYGMVADKVEVLYGDSIQDIEQSETGVRVSFERHSPREVGRVIGADGLHSNTRHMAFGNGSLERYLGYDAASFGVAGYPTRDEAAYVSYSVPGRQIARYALRDDRTVFFFIGAADAELTKAKLDTRDQKRLLTEAFADMGWESRDIVAALDSADDFYFDLVCQVRTERWSSGRVALTGDAAFCPSLLAGEGASLAMAAAYVLAGELKKADGDHAVAYREYERQLGPFIAGKQRSAERFAAWFAPKTRLGIQVRNVMTRLMSRPVLANWMMGGMIPDRFALPEYERD